MIGNRPIPATQPATSIPGNALLSRPARRAPRQLAVAAVDNRDLRLSSVILFCAAHAGLALLFKNVHAMAGVHALVTLAIGISFSLRKNNPMQIAQWVAYVMGAEVLWRMTKAPIPWEFAKYAITLICVLSIIKVNRVKGSWLPLLYFGLLFPASFLTFAQLPLDEARQQVSFVLSGPLCLATFALWCSGLRLSVNGFSRVGVALLAPIIGVAFLVVFRLATTDTSFGISSTSDASGGYGPNQVSSLLSLGAPDGRICLFGRTTFQDSPVVLCSNGCLVTGSGHADFLPHRDLPFQRRVWPCIDFSCAVETAQGQTLGACRNPRRGRLPPITHAQHFYRGQTRRTIRR